MKINLKTITFALLAATVATHQINAMDAKQRLLERYVRNTCGGNINRADKDGNTLLHTAVRQGRLDTIKLLLENGANINQPNKSGEAALYLAVYQENFDAIKLLLENGADINQSNNDDETPIQFAQFAQEGNHDDIAEYLTLCNDFFDIGIMVDETQVVNPTVIPDYFALTVLNDDASGLRQMFLQHANNQANGYSLNLKRYIKQAKLTGKQKSLHELLALQKLTNPKKQEQSLILYAPHKPTTWTHESIAMQASLKNNPNFSDVTFVKEFKN